MKSSIHCNNLPTPPFDYVPLTHYSLSDKVSGSGVPGKEKGVGRGDVVELYGPSGSGKSEVLINVVARCVLPAWLGGEERTAVFFDNGESERGAAQTTAGPMESSLSCFFYLSWLALEDKCKEGCSACLLSGRGKLCF